MQKRRQFKKLPPFFLVETAGSELAGFR